MQVNKPLRRGSSLEAAVSPSETVAYVPVVTGRGSVSHQTSREAEPTVDYATISFTGSGLWLLHSFSRLCCRAWRDGASS